jgi:D-serine deaminase-like pyridoxal phosphate-dependent protein
MNKRWYALNHPEQTDSPALLVYPDRVSHNIREMIRIAGSARRLVPHIKTHKMSAIVKMQLEAGISRFKCATIAEAEMLAKTGAAGILLAYQLNQPKAFRFMQLVQQYPEVNFASLVDNIESARLLNDLFAESSLTANVYVDVDNGMHRTGIPAEDIPALYKQLSVLPNLHCLGLHVYDGHIHGNSFEDRKQMCEAAFAPVAEAIKIIEAAGLSKPEVVAGGSPTFPIHASNPEVLCSPGTGLLWDEGYARLLPEQPFLRAAVLLTRIISKPRAGYITTDLGHKSVAAENPIGKRVFFLNLEDYEAVSQSEEHLVVKVNNDDWQKLEVGDVLYGVPYHICPTVALYDEVQVVDHGEVTGQWAVEARRKKITV